MLEDKAKELMHGMPEMEPAAEESEDMEHEEDMGEEECSPEELQMKIKELQSKLDAMKK